MVDKFWTHHSNNLWITVFLYSRRVIVTDHVFSIGGDIAPLKEISALATKYNALLFLNECHAANFIGKTDRGTEELYGLNGQVVIINSTLDGAMGGYTTGPQESFTSKISLSKKEKLP